MRRRLLAAALGTATGLGGLAWAEAWQRGRELGSARVWFDPPGLKYVLDEREPDNGRGWREGELPPGKEGLRLVCLGDSVTYGVGVARWESWCAELGRRLGRVETRNFGMNGWDAEQVATLLEARVGAWEPDLVVWGAYVNDLFPTYLLYGQESGDPVFVGTDVPAQARPAAAGAAGAAPRPAQRALPPPARRRIRPQRARGGPGARA